MKLTVLGASPSFPNPGKPCSGYLVQDGSTRVLLECGHGVAAALISLTNPAELDAIAITHMHADHFLDLVPLSYDLRFIHPRAQPLPLWLPPGGLGRLSAVWAALGIEEGALSTWYDPREYDPAAVLNLGTFRFHFAPTDHFVPGYAVRVSSGGRELGYSSDTGPSPRVEELLQGADLALIEATEIDTRSPTGHAGHLTARQAGEMAARAAVQRLVLVHYADGLAAQVYADAGAAFRGEVLLALAGETYCV